MISIGAGKAGVASSYAIAQQAIQHRPQQLFAMGAWAAPASPTEAVASALAELPNLRVLRNDVIRQRVDDSSTDPDYSKTLSSEVYQLLIAKLSCGSGVVRQNR